MHEKASINVCTPLCVRAYVQAPLALLCGGDQAGSSLTLDLHSTYSMHTNHTPCTLQERVEQGDSVWCYCLWLIDPPS